MSSDVEWIQTLRVVFVRETPECKGPRGWGEGAVTYVDVEKAGDDIHIRLEGENYKLSAEVVEAIYDLHNEEKG